MSNNDQKNPWAHMVPPPKKKAKPIYPIAALAALAAIYIAYRVTEPKHDGMRAAHAFHVPKSQAAPAP